MATTTLDLEYTPERYETLRRAATNEDATITLDLGGGQCAQLVVVALTRRWPADGRGRLCVELRERRPARPQDPRP
jgi:hypothetical protein